MEQFKEVLQKRLYALAAYAAGLTLLVVMGLFRTSAGETEEIRAFMMGVNAGLLAVALVVSVMGAARYMAALRDAQKRKALYIYERDERRLYIQSQIGGAAIQWILSGLTVATVVSEYFDQTVFFTLLGAVLFSAAVKAVFKIVYTRKLT